MHKELILMHYIPLAVELKRLNSTAFFYLKIRNITKLKIAGVELIDSR